MEKNDKTGTVSLRSVVDSHPEPFALIDEHFTIVACNRQYAEAYTDLTPDDVVGMKCHEVSHKSKDRCDLNGEECPLDRVFGSRQPVQVIHQHLDRRRKPYYVTVYGTPIQSGNGRVQYFGEAMSPISRAEELEFDEEQLVGCCPSFMTMLDNLTLVAHSDLPVLIHGETGTGKELAALYLHRKSRRAKKEFVTVDCTTLSDQMFVAELFGHESGAFTGSSGMKQGLVEVADGGTLFLDEIGEIDADIQAKLLRVLDRRTFRRLGSNRERKVDFRLICATNRDLAKRVEEGRFRADLFYRINPMQITLPALRHRKEDIPQLVTFFLRKMMPAQLAPMISDEALELLLRYDFPGNVRELKHALDRAVVIANRKTLKPEHLPEAIRYAKATTMPDRAEHEGHHDGCVQDPEMIRLALARFGGNRRKTAAFLKISESTLYRRIKQLGLS